MWGQGRYNLLHREHYSCILINVTLFLDSFYIKLNSESLEACYSSDPIIWIPAVHRGLHYERAAKRNRLNALNKSINNIPGEAWIAALVFRAMLKRCKYYIQMHIIYKLNVEVFVWRLCVCRHFEQQGRHVVCIKDTQTDGCRGWKKRHNTTLNIHKSNTLKCA